MPHLTLEYSANLEDLLDMTGLCAAAADAACATGFAAVQGIRVRAIRCDHYAVADRDERNAFIDASLRVGKARSDEMKGVLGRAVFDAIRAYCGELFDSPYFALSLELRQIDNASSWKENGIASRFPSSG